MSNQTSVIELAPMPGSDSEYGYKLVSRNGTPARAFNDPANGQKAPKLIAHDWQQHGFKEICDGNYDELVAIGAQYYAIPEFIDEEGGLPGFIAYQLQAIGRKNNSWEMDFAYTVDDKLCRDIITSQWHDIVTTTNTMLATDFSFYMDVLLGNSQLHPLEYDNKAVHDVVCKTFTKGYHFAQRIYRNRDNANKLYWKIVEQLKPYVSDVSASSPARLYLHVQIHKGIVEVTTDGTHSELTTASN